MISSLAFIPNKNALKIPIHYELSKEEADLLK